MLELEEELVELLELLVLELEELLLELEVPPVEILPADTLKLTLSSLAPSSRRRIYRVWEPADTLLKVVGFKVPQPEVEILFWVLQEPESSL